MAATIQSNNRRIARNTLFLYMRMGITMIVQLYTSRIVLDALGIDNYGIYNVVGSVIVMFTFVSGPLTAATQRFFSYELGRKDGGEISKIFNTSLIVYLALALLLVIVIEIVGDGMSTTGSTSRPKAARRHNGCFTCRSSLSWSCCCAPPSSH